MLKRVQQKRRLKGGKLLNIKKIVMKMIQNGFPVVKKLARKDEVRFITY